MALTKFRARVRLYRRALSTPEEPVYVEPGQICDLDVGYDDPDKQLTPDQVEMLIAQSAIARVTAEEVAEYDRAMAEMQQPVIREVISYTIEDAAAQPDAVPPKPSKKLSVKAEAQESVEEKGKTS